MKQLKKTLLAILAIAVVLGCFTGCEEEVKELSTGTITREELKAFEEKAGGLDLPLDDKGTTLTVMVASDLSDLNESVGVTELRRRTGINLDLLAVPTATLADKAKVLLASKQNMPDVFYSFFTEDERKEFGKQGAFAAINKYQDELPNFKRIFVDKPEEYGTEVFMKGSVADDGNLYIFPKYDITREVNHGMLYRKDIFDKHNLKMWNSPEEFYETLKKLKELYPDSTPFVSKNMNDIFWHLAPSWGINDLGQLYYNTEEKVWKHSSIDPKVKNMLDYLKKLYDEKLIDPEFLTCTQAVWNQKMVKESEAFVTFDWIGRLEQFAQTSEVPGYDLRYANPIGPEGKVVTLSRFASGPQVTNNDNTLLSLKFLDYLLSEGGAELTTMGIEGVTYNMNEETGFADYIGFDKVPSINEISEKYGLYIDGMVMRSDRRSCYFHFTEKEQEAQDMMKDKHLPEDPGMSYTPEQLGILNKDFADLDKAFKEFGVKYILSENPNETGDKAWDAWVKKATSTWNIEECVNLANDVYKKLYK